MENRKWQKPELIVLVRSKPEEHVLAACKGDGATKVTAWVQNNGCMWWEFTICDNLCSDQANS